jgi:serine/threonine protein kinase
VTEVLGVSELLDNLKRSKLLSAEKMEAATKAAASSALSGAAFGRWLVTNALLTPYQLVAVSTGNLAELRIGNYEVLDRIGAGGMGTVFKARHERMKRIVALKVLSRSLAKEDESFVRRFQREVETIARLSHPNIVMAYDADEDEAGPFLAMEYVSGRDLASVVEKDGQLSVVAAVNCILQAARGLDYAHSQGIIHRDIKPANLLRDAAGVVKVTDLGVARLNTADVAATAGGITQTGTVLGSVNYMSPEQAVDSSRIDCRADIYSLGATLYFLLTGRPPYQAQTMMAVLLKHRDAPIPALAEAGTDIPAALEGVFRRMLAKAPADRYQTMAEVITALEAVEASLGQKVPTPSLAPRADKPGPSSSPGQHPETIVEVVAEATDQTIDQKRPSTFAASILKVALIEPSRTQSGIIRKYLQGQGVQNIVAAGSGQEALQMIRADPPHGVVAAMYLPDMTGVQLARQIREQSGATAPGFVLISSEDECADAGSLSKCGKAVLLQKPFTPEKLMDALRLVTSQPASSMPSSKRMVERRDLRVLIVDDSTSARLHIQNVLRALGLSLFVVATDGAQAVAALTKQTFDLIVTDYNMPFMDGRGLVGYLKQNPATAAVPIIMVTSETDPAKLAAVRELGVAAVCDKSFQPEIVGKILDGLSASVV